MTPSFHAWLVNGRAGDPALFVDFRFEKRALLFDLGDLRLLAPRKMLRIAHVFISHTHIDHFIGFDELLRSVLGREQTIGIHGPAGVIDSVAAKLAAYTWNLATRFKTDLRFVVTEMLSETHGRSAVFRLQNRFRAEDARACAFQENVILAADTFRVEASLLDHQIPCLGFALREKSHVNVWKNRIEALGLPVGSWLNELKQAVMDDRPDDTPIAVYGRAGPSAIERRLPLGLLKRDALKITPGQKIAYVTDVAFTPSNADRIKALARNADLFFVEAPFMRRDEALAAARAHLTTAQAGGLAREAGARRVEPFHFSPRYEGEEESMLQEVYEAFRGAPPGSRAEEQALKPPA
jgi:ribonuclease Z